MVWKMKILQKFRLWNNGGVVGNTPSNSGTVGKDIAYPILGIRRVDFKYSVGSSRFEDFNYFFDFGLSHDQSARLMESKQGIEKIIDVLSGVYSQQDGFSVCADGNISSNQRQARWVYSTSNDSQRIANLNFTVDYAGSGIDKSSAFLLLYNHNDERRLFFVHDLIIGIKDLKISPGALDSLSQIDNIRNGKCPSVKNFLLS